MGCLYVTSQFLEDEPPAPEGSKGLRSSRFIPSGMQIEGAFEISNRRKSHRDIEGG